MLCTKRCDAQNAVMTGQRNEKKQNEQQKMGFYPQQAHKIRRGEFQVHHNASHAVRTNVLWTLHAYSAPIAKLQLRAEVSCVSTTSVDRIAGQLSIC